MNKSPVHIPVLFNEVLEYLAPIPGNRFIDATAGEGGHVIGIARLVAPQGKVLAIECDPDEKMVLDEHIQAQGLTSMITTIHGNFRDIRTIAGAQDFILADGVLMDLGFSSWQLERSRRGFSFQRIEPLDMRLDPTDESRPTAAEIVNSTSREHLAWILREYGEEQYAERIAKAIFEKRRKEHLKTTEDLVHIVTIVVPRRGKLHPATKTFQALRIAVNNELEILKQGLDGAKTILASRGKLAVITFHSLEDRLVKNLFRSWEDRGEGKRLFKKVVRPTRREVLENPRSRSAKLRIFVRK